MNRNVILLIAGLFLCVSVTAWSQTAGKAIALSDTLGEVVVTARQIREVIPGQTLSGKQLKSLSSNSVADALLYFSWVQVKDY